MTEHADIQRLNSNQVMSAVTILIKRCIYQGRCQTAAVWIFVVKRGKCSKIDQLLKLVGTDKSRLLSAQLLVKTWKTFKPSMHSGLNGSRDVAHQHAQPFRRIW